MKTLSVGLCLFASALTLPAFAADGERATTTRGTVVDAPVASSRDRTNTATPERGMTKAEVVAAFGQPDTRRGPVGEPPISHWRYPDFAVYFEYDKVLHAVVPDNPPPVHHRGELASGG